MSFRGTLIKSMLIIFSITGVSAYDTSSGYADIHITIVDAKMTPDGSLKSYSAPQVTLGLGALGVWMDHLMVATSMDISYRRLDDELSEDFIFGFGTDLKVGYYLAGWSIYMLGNFQMQDYGTWTTYYGIGYGGGLEYRLSESWAMNIESKSTTMYSADFRMDDYSYRTTGVSLKYLF